MTDSTRSTPLPETLTYSMEPYTNGAVIADLRWEGEYRGHPLLLGTVVSGTERAFLGGHSAVKDIAGRTVTVYGAREEEIAAGRIVRIAS